MTRKKHYVAVYERDSESDAWLVHIKGIPGWHTHGPTLRQADERIREALAFWLDREPGEVVLEHQWPEAVADVAAEVAGARGAVLEASQLASEATSRAVRRLTRMGSQPPRHG